MTPRHKGYGYVLGPCVMFRGYGYGLWLGIMVRAAVMVKGQSYGLGKTGIRRKSLGQGAL